jgi:hypothetical protein
MLRCQVAVERPGPEPDVVMLDQILERLTFPAHGLEYGDLHRLSFSTPTGSLCRPTAAGHARTRADRKAWREAALSGHRRLLIRRNRTTGELAYHRCHSTAPTPLPVLVKVAGSRWRVEETFSHSGFQTVALMCAVVTVVERSGAVVTRLSHRMWWTTPV